jgi:hypothetical protein
LNVSDKDSPYALIDKYFPERESYYFQNQNKFIHEYNKGGNKTDIGRLLPEEVWLSDGKLLVLKGGKTRDRNGFDNPWEPLDNYQAPYREPVLPPPDFDPDSIEVRVDIPEVKVIVTTPIPPTQSFNFGGLRQITQEKISKEYNPTPGIEKNPPYVNPEVALKSFKDQVNKGNTDSYNNFFLSDVKKFIADMENFHSA